MDPNPLHIRDTRKEEKKESYFTKYLSIIARKTKKQISHNQLVILNDGASKGKTLKQHCLEGKKNIKIGNSRSLLDVKVLFNINYTII